MTDVISSPFTVSLAALSLDFRYFMDVLGCSFVAVVESSSSSLGKSSSFVDGAAAKKSIYTNL